MSQPEDKPVDVIVENWLGLWVFRPQTPEGRQWLQDLGEGTWVDGALEVGDEEDALLVVQVLLVGGLNVSRPENRLRPETEDGEAIH